MEFTLITNGLILDSGQAAASRGDILIEGDTIKTVTAPGLSAPPEARVIDATDRLIIPGLINSHTHGHGSLYKGSGDRWTLELLLKAGPWISGQESGAKRFPL